MGLNNSFSAVMNNKLSRGFGGSIAGVADPYVSGYHFISFTNLPSALNKYAGGMDNAQIGNLLSGACLSVTPPGGTLNKVEFTGLGGIKWSVPGNVDYGNSVSVKFLEFSGTPILNIFHGWVKMIRDYRSGVSNLSEGAYTKANYSALMYYWTTAPDAKTVEYYACYDGVFPTKDPQDLFASDVETVGRVDPEIEFNVDYIWHEDWVKTNCTSYANDIFGLKAKVIETYGSTIGATK